MKIASRFRDYYDSAATFGVDRTVVYVRNTSEPKKISEYDVVTNDYSFNSRIKHGAQVLKIKVNITYFLLGFCGQVYPGVQLEVLTENLTPLTKLYCYSLDKLESVLKKRLGYTAKRERERLFWIYAFSLHGVDEFFRKNYSDLIKIFYAGKCPIFVVEKLKEHSRRYQSLTLNPQLSKYHFQTVKDPHTAFQDIQMYISGVLGTPERPMVKISDKKLAEKRGHGGKYSFRKPPGEKKRRKKK